MQQNEKCTQLGGGEVRAFTRTEARMPPVVRKQGDLREKTPFLRKRGEWDRHSPRGYRSAIKGSEKASRATDPHHQDKESTEGPSRLKTKKRSTPVKLAMMKK